MFVTVDLLIWDSMGLNLVKRKYDPYKGCWALPGGFDEEGETVEEAAVREALEETGLEVKLLNIEKVLSQPERDPRGRTISIVYSAEAIGGELKASDDAEDVKRFKEVPERVAFDHGGVIEWYLKVCSNHK